MPLQNDTFGRQKIASRTAVGLSSPNQADISFPNEKETADNEWLQGNGTRSNKSTTTVYAGKACVVAPVKPEVVTGDSSIHDRNRTRITMRDPVKHQRDRNGATWTNSGHGSTESPPSKQSQVRTNDETQESAKRVGVPHGTDVREVSSQAEESALPRRLTYANLGGRDAVLSSALTDV